MVWHHDQPAVAVDQASIFWIRTESPKEMLIFDGTGTTTQNKSERSTDIVLDAKCQESPGGSMTIYSPDVNYSRQVEISGSDDKKDWSLLTTGYIMKYDTPQFKGEKSKIELSDNGYRYVRVRIRNYDDQPISIHSIRIYTPRNRVMFPYTPGQQYRLYYGSRGATAPVYDFQQTAQYIPASSATELTLGAQEKNPQFSAAAAPGSWMEENPWIIWAVLAVAVIFLGTLTFRMFLQMKDQGSQQ
jgi:hypothetical protein